MKKLLAFALSAALLAGAAAAVTPEETFPDKNTYPGFIDVAQDAWYADAARVCCEIGLMQGTGQAFAPDQILTVGEVAAIAARMNEAITGELIPMATPAAGQTLPWYFSYVQYLEGLGIDVPVPEKQATRQEFVTLLSAVIPEEMLSPINTISSLPDSSDTNVLAFYSAGILTGVDRWGTFAPGGSLTRAETAAMVARVARPALRQSFTPADYTPFTAAYLTPSTVLFSDGTTASPFLDAVNAAIYNWEVSLCREGQEFNWHLETQDGQTVLEHVKADALESLGVTAGMGTEAYRNFDVQVYYSRLIDLTGHPLGWEETATAGA